MIVLVTGASGLIGREFVRSCASRDCTVRRLVRGPATGQDTYWNPDAGEIDRAALEGADVVVHLAGEPLADGRWSAAKKRRIRESRRDGTRLLAQSMAAMERPPVCMLSASAIGFYGSQDGKMLDESSPPGAGFLADVCREWEDATTPASNAGVRVVNLRLGVVLSPEGGALKKMLPVFRLGLGGRLGSGEQYMSWIARDDVIGAMWHVIERPGISGPVNFVAPTPVTNAEFTRTLAGRLHRPAVLDAPRAVLRLVLGEMADETLLASARVVPGRLLGSGYLFAKPDLNVALESLLAGP